MKILNLYAGIGGNRKLWGNDHDITAVELDPEIAKIYKDFFHSDNVIVDDAHQYLIEHYKEFDFIWTSPPCPTHSRARFWGWHKNRPVYPSMILYEEIIFLKHHFEKMWVAENVKPYYEPLMPAKEIGRHLFWSNFAVCHIEHKSSDIRKMPGKSKKDKMIRNMVDPEIGLHILNCAMGKKPIQTNQTELKI